jgi:patatin-like phospholipase/acyl hydrolase
MPEVRQPQYQTAEQARAVEECLNLYSRERKKLLEELEKRKHRFDGYSHKNTIQNVIDIAP